MKKFLKAKIIDPILNLLKQGVTPEKIALSIAFGILLGVFPVIGSTVILCTIATFLFKLNFIAIQLANYLIYPVQFILFIPFIRLGETVLGSDPFPLSMELIFNMLKEDILLAIKTFWVANLHGIFGWFLIGPISIYICYRILLPILRKVPLHKLQGNEINE
ncbi:MAG: DUF2062 domain-containing protein [Leptospiraceae bacterium]|nr:DUF2062 domain-containing protein [Leptospiraceae bacterium]MCP5510949.1 DUF2062 domain-containing protein [Leptospiraceae bacterium]